MKALKWILIVVAALVLIGWVGLRVLTHQTKQASPEQTVVYEGTDLTLSVFYNRPSKKGREIFGELVPYGKTWRTGANEATVFTTNRDITFGGEKLAAGSYTLWTIPQKSQWTVILNSKMYDWGVNWNNEASRDPQYDVLKINVPVEDMEEVTEEFTIEFIYNVNLQMRWDQTKVIIPILTYI